MTKDSLIQQAFEVAAERYAAVGVDVRKALEDMKKISLSLHCWQADDVSGFENQGGSLTGGIQVTGNYPGRARTIDELRRDVRRNPISPVIIGLVCMRSTGISKGRK